MHVPRVPYSFALFADEWVAVPNLREGPSSIFLSST